MQIGCSLARVDRFQSFGVCLCYLSNIQNREMKLRDGGRTFSSSSPQSAALFTILGHHSDEYIIDHERPSISEVFKLCYLSVQLSLRLRNILLCLILFVF